MRLKLKRNEKKQMIRRLNVISFAINESTLGWERDIADGACPNLYSLVHFIQCLKHVRYF